MKRVTTLFHSEWGSGSINNYTNKDKGIAISIGDLFANLQESFVLLSLETAKAYKADLEEKIKELENQQQ